MPNRQEAISGLADYMTNKKRVVSHSMALEMDGARKAEANAFFGLRGAFNVTGYATKEEAEKAIAETLSK